MHVKSSALFAVLIPLVAGAAPTSLQFVPPSPNQFEQRVVPLPNGSVAIAGWQNQQISVCFNVSTSQICSSESLQQPVVWILDSSGAGVANNFSFGTGAGVIFDAAADSSGNLWIVGQTNSDDFPLAHPLFTAKPAYMKTGFVAKLDPQLNILFATFLGGTQTKPTNIVVDRSGNAYIAGNTADPSFPTTGPVLGTGSPGPSNNYITPLFYGFVAKISSDGSRLIYSRVLGGDQTTCQVSDFLCNQAGPNTAPSVIAVDPSGNVTLAGLTNSSTFPTTAGAYQMMCGCGSNTTAGFVARLPADGSALLWSTFIGTGRGVPSVALDASDNVYIAGNQFSSFDVAKLSADGAKFLYSTSLDGPDLSGLTLDGSGNVWITGSTNSPNFPGLPNAPPDGIDFALELKPDGSAPQTLVPLVLGDASRPRSIRPGICCFSPHQEACFV